MAKAQTNVLEAKASQAIGAALDVSVYDRKAVYVTGTFVATVQVQISPDASGSAWVDEGAALTAAGAVEITKPCRRVRLNTTAYTSGTPVGRLVGSYG